MCRSPTGFETPKSACSQSRERVPKKCSRTDCPMFWLDAAIVPMTLPPASSRSTLTSVFGSVADWLLSASVVVTGNGKNWVDCGPAAFGQAHVQSGHLKEQIIRPAGVGLRSNRRRSQSRRWLRLLPALRRATLLRGRGGPTSTRRNSHGQCKYGFRDGSGYLSDLAGSRYRPSSHGEPRKSGPRRRVLHSARNCLRMSHMAAHLDPF